MIKHTIGPTKLGPIFGPSTAKRRSTFLTLSPFHENRIGDVKQLKGFQPPMFRLRIGAWRATFHKKADNTIEAVRVRKRGEIYRR